MALVVQKFGGTSVASVDHIQRVARRVVNSLRAGDKVVVVVSAMSGETNRLDDLGMAVSERPPGREMDVLLASGEQVTIALLSMALADLGYPGKSFLAHQIRIHTDSNHRRARIERIETGDLEAALAEGVVPVVAGFQGIVARAT